MVRCVSDSGSDVKEYFLKVVSLLRKKRGLEVQ